MMVQEAIPHFQASTGDSDVDDIEEHLRRERHIISQTSWRIESAIRSIYETAASEIRDKGRETANEIYDCSDEDAAETMLEKSYREVDNIASRCEETVFAKIEELASDC